MRSFLDEIVNETDGKKRYDLVDRNGNVLVGDVWLRPKSLNTQNGTPWAAKEANNVVYKDELADNKVFTQDTFSFNIGTTSFDGELNAKASMTKYINLPTGINTNSADITLTYGIGTMTVLIRRGNAIRAYGNVETGSRAYFASWGKLESKWWNTPKTTESAKYDHFGLGACGEYNIALTDAKIETVSNQRRIALVFKNEHSTDKGKINCTVRWEAF